MYTSKEYIYSLLLEFEIQKRDGGRGRTNNLPNSLYYI